MTSKSTPRLFVGMPVYNGEAHLESSILSLLSQSYSDFVVHISDNCSTDSTPDICRDMMSRDDRVQYSRVDKNQGATANYNRLVAVAQGEFFKWASSNDTCDPALFGACVSALDDNPDAVLAFPKTTLLDPATNSTIPYEDNLHLDMTDPVERFVSVIERLSMNNAMNGVFRLADLKSNCLIGNFIAGDKNMIAELSLVGKIVNVPEYLFTRTISPETATKLQSPEEVQKHMDPTQASPMEFQVWQQIHWYFRSVWSAPLTFSQKSRLFGFLMRYSISIRDHLAADLRDALRS